MDDFDSGPQIDEHLEAEYEEEWENFDNDFLLDEDCLDFDLMWLQ